jgi:hypothetical protein
MANQSSLPARTAAIDCYKAIYLYIGDTIETLLDKLKPQQKESIKKELADHKEKNPNYVRKTRSEKAKEAKYGVEEVKQ